MKTSRILFSLLAAVVVLTAGIWVVSDPTVQAQDNNQPGLVVFASDRTGNFEIYVLDPETGLTTQLTNDPAVDIEPAWSPDGTTIAFVSDRDGDFELFVMRPDGSAVQQLTNNMSEDRLPRWQPNGLFILFSSDVNGQWDLYVVTADGAIVRQLTNDAGDERGPAAAAALIPQPAVPTVEQPPAAPAAGDQAGAGDTMTPDATVSRPQINLRENPGEGAQIVKVLPFGTPVQIVGRRQDNTWLQVKTFDGVQGWAFASLLDVTADLSGVPVVNAPFIAPPPTPTWTPTSTPTNTPEPTKEAVSISFTVNNGTITAGECVTVSWAVSGIKEVYYQGTGVAGQGSSEECPAATATYELRVVKTDDSVDTRYITVTVNP
ncbi:MAG: PD40 domain-containing protein [Anaerolineae bacterium]|nr:PD40 domain-containing protein [Anaerolineae bacterium]